MKVTVDNAAVLKLLDTTKIAGEKIMGEAIVIFKKSTPIKSGNARRRTKLKDKMTILADYPYAKRLDQGASKQSPKGMVKPTIDYIKKTIVPNSIRRLNRG